MIERLAERNRLGLKAWKRSNDASVVPDRGFRKQLKCLDKTLEVIWDCVIGNWEIWSFPENGLEPYLVMRVGKVDSYEELSQNVLLQMQQNIFMANNCTPKQICNYLEEYEEQLERRREKDFRNKIMARAIDTRAYAQEVLQIQVPRSMKIRKAVESAII